MLSELVKILKFSPFFHQFSVFLDFLKKFFLDISGGVRGSHLYIFFSQKIQKHRKLVKKGGKSMKTCCTHWVVTIIAQKVIRVGEKCHFLSDSKKTCLYFLNKSILESTKKWAKKSLQKLLRACQKRVIFFSKIQTHADMIFLIMVLGRHFGMY